jgi:5-methylcytosine-specific restriction protein A
MRIADLPEPVVTAKSDWLVASHWIGFTPVGTGPDATSRCTSAIARQAAGGYVVEYITQSFGEPNPGSEQDARFLSDREEHRKFAGKLVGVHKLRPTARPLREIVGEEEYECLQDTWAKDGHRNRWSVAFPIIESYAIADDREASRIFGAEAMKRLFAHLATR